MFTTDHTDEHGWEFSVAAHGGGGKRRGAATVRTHRIRNESPVAEGDDLGSILKVEPDRRAGFACPPQEETRSAIAFHLWREICAPHSGCGDKGSPPLEGWPEAGVGCGV